MKTCLVTGGAGFIGSNLVRFLLNKGMRIIVLDNLSTGKRSNLEEIMDQIDFVEGDLRDFQTVQECVDRSDGIFHLAALGSVPRSMKEPQITHAVNVNGTLHLLEAVRQSRMQRIVFSASSSAYGDQERSPKTESMAPYPISPYAASKLCCEAYMQAYAKGYGMKTVSLRYFNVFGPRQDPSGAYAAVIPAFVSAMIHGSQPIVFGDGQQTRDFCFVENVCNANWLAMNAPASICDGSPINIACGEAISLNAILKILRNLLKTNIEAVYQDRRPGDVQHSLADIHRAKERIGYEPLVFFREGIQRAIDWYVRNL